ncbi:gamma-mobile-trio recombinase GmtY [Hydrogenophaga sp. 2FB]|uniref:gamma-mobile-trio recombinase GmtY n=1 Tax=Hydrogenophaga sp. 2FB TaxID=2502187 RepID=UPI0010F6F161|nr:gamma-mobile-trio recombinase GmtY [Hydrogenophaga sp. 2FB]
MFVATRARVIVDSTGAASEIVAVLTPEGVLLPLVNYFRFYATTRSVPWQQKVAHGVVLFMEYMVANPHEMDRQLMFQNFVLRLSTGTFNEKTRLDPSGLGWTVRKPDVVSSIVHSLTNFFKYLKRDRPFHEQLNPAYSKTPFDQMIDHAAYIYRREAAMLGHTWLGSVRESLAPSVKAAKRPKVIRKNPPAFPESKFEELLVKGFLGGANRDYRGACITLLMHGAGFRESEPFHLYVQDVFPTPGDLRSSTVLIHHPTHGEPPSDWTSSQGRPSSANREQYLAQCYGLRPRHLLAGKLRAGWKNPLLDESYFMRAHWFTEQYGNWFSELWDGYMRQLVNVPRSHPWAFVNLSREPIGAPYSLSQFNKAHAAACKRIGLEVAKSLGTTRHGHRHAYGQRARAAGVDSAYIKIFMHHKSLEAQQTYTVPSPAEIAHAIADGMKKLETKHLLPKSYLADALEDGVEAHTLSPSGMSGNAWTELQQKLQNIKQGA